MTNASRTLLMNLHTLQWDPALLKFFGIKASVLPKIVSSSEVYGKIAYGPLKGVSIAGLAGDQQAALVGNKCLAKGEAKCTYGTGAFLLFCTGEDIVESQHGLLTTVNSVFNRISSFSDHFLPSRSRTRTGPTRNLCTPWKAVVRKPFPLDSGEATYMSLRCAVGVAGSAVKWLRDSMCLVASAADVNVMSAKVADTGGVYFVTALGGLFEPYWDPSATGVIIGMWPQSDSSTQANGKRDDRTLLFHDACTHRACDLGGQRVHDACCA